MADQIYLSYRMRNWTGAHASRAFEKMLRTFPHSRLAKSSSTLRIVAVSFTEPPLFEQSFESPADTEAVLEVARGFDLDDCQVAFDTWWDLWQYEKEWKLAPAQVTLNCFGPQFEIEREDDVRVEFGIDTHFLPQTDLPNFLFMSQSNIRSLLRLVSDLDAALNAATRRLWTESGENFAARLQASLDDDEPASISG